MTTSHDAAALATLIQQAAQRLQAQPVSDEEAYAWIGAALEGETAVTLRAREDVRRRVQPAALVAEERTGMARHPDEAAAALFGLTRASAIAAGHEAVHATGILDDVLRAVCQALRAGQPVTEALAGMASFLALLPSPWQTALAVAGLVALVLNRVREGWCQDQGGKPVPSQPEQPR